MWAQYLGERFTNKCGSCHYLNGIANQVITCRREYRWNRESQGWSPGHCNIHRSREERTPGKEIWREYLQVGPQAMCVHFQGLLLFQIRIKEWLAPQMLLKCLEQWEQNWFMNFSERKVLGDFIRTISVKWWIRSWQDWGESVKQKRSQKVRQLFAGVWSVWVKDSALGGEWGSRFVGFKDGRYMTCVHIDGHDVVKRKSFTMLVEE